MKLRSLLLVLSLLAPLPTQAEEAPGDETRPSVIFFIGDGMGISQVTLGRLAAQRLGRPYAFDRFPVTGLASTRSANNAVTDSAAAATALSGGVKTTNASIGVDARGRPVRGILHVAAAAGYRTGVVTTARVTHATPAAFSVHTWNREEEDKIARLQAGGGAPDLLVGGGSRFFSADARAEATANGYTIASDLAGVRAAASGARVLGLLSPSHLPYAVDRPHGFPSLQDLTRVAVQRLASGDAPFALMVEAGRIDHACHSHDAATMVHEVLDLSEALQWALDARERYPELLIVVTADHATGGLAISETVQLERLIRAKASAERLVQDFVPADASAETLTPLRDAVFSRHAEVELGRKELATVVRHLGRHWQAMALGHLLSERYGISFYELETAHDLKHTHAHDGALVGVFAAGPGAERFAGLYENTEIPRRIADVLGVSLDRELTLHKK